VNALHLAWLALAWAATVYVATYHLSSLAMILVAWRERLRQQRYRLLEIPEIAEASGELPGVTLVIPAFNEQASICRTVESALQQRHRDVEVVVVNDGSTDQTLALLMDRFGLRLSERAAFESIPSQAVRAVFESTLDPRLIVIDKRNGGKADALNVGINHARKPLACLIDADVVLDPWALLHLVLPFVEDPTTVATSGTIRLQNGCRIDRGRISHAALPERWLERLQVVEYLRAYALGRLCFNTGSTHLIISGAFGLFRRSVLLEVDGFQPHAIGEDMELVVRIHRMLRERRRPYRITFVADAICYTEAPHTLRDLGQQRTRWHQGLLTTLRLHRDMAFNPRFGAVGLFSFPYYLAFELAAPVVESAGWCLSLLGLLTGLIGPGAFVAYLAATLGLGLLVSASAIALDDMSLASFRGVAPKATLTACALLEQVGYHQATLYFRLRAFVRFYRQIHLKSGWLSPARQAGRPGRGQ
jgi:cellulose synthase/poly-beta-1,6-N-acetylglucosamine synthase-like glycosyltransferase